MGKQKGEFVTPTSEDFDHFKDKLFDDSGLFPTDDPADLDIEAPILNVDLDEVNEESIEMANLVTERLSGFYFDDDYTKKHPYIETKIMMEMNNIRRLLKMLSINEKSQDVLIQNIAIGGSKAALYTSLTALQNVTLSIQKQLNDLISGLEQIFQKMQDECEKTFQEKEKEGLTDGSLVVRGSREFIQELSARIFKRKQAEKAKSEEEEIQKVIINDSPNELDAAEIQKLFGETESQIQQ
jgi:hypothetical protein